MEKEKNSIKNTNVYKASFVTERKLFNDFKQMCKLNDSDASKELRKLLKQYLNENDVEGY